MPLSYTCRLIKRIAAVVMSKTLNIALAQRNFVVGSIEQNGRQICEDIERARQAGADLVQIYTGFIYQGPSLINDIRRTTTQENLDG